MARQIALVMQQKRVIIMTITTQWMWQSSSLHVEFCPVPLFLHSSTLSSAKKTTALLLQHDTCMQYYINYYKNFTAYKVNIFLYTIPLYADAKIATWYMKEKSKEN